MQTEAATAITCQTAAPAPGGQLFAQVPVSIESRSAHGSPFGRSCNEAAAAWNAYVAGAGISGPQNDARDGATYAGSRREPAPAVRSMSIVKPVGFVRRAGAGRLVAATRAAAAAAHQERRDDDGWTDSIAHPARLTPGATATLTNG